LARLEHSGAVGADGKSSDGVGVTTAIPRSWLLAQSGLTLDAKKLFGVGVVFLPEDDEAQPFRTLAHNGEINTIWGNRARMEARAATLPLDLYPVLTEGGSDSTSLDEIVELLAHNGRTVGEAVRMMVPPANLGNCSSFLQYCGDCMEPWDGPAALAFTDGRQVGAILDRNGLRPCRFALDDQGLVVAGSEAGLVDMDPSRIVHSGRSCGPSFAASRNTWCAFLTNYHPKCGCCWPSWVCHRWRPPRDGPTCWSRYAAMRVWT
jgi:glutamate synthase domain-containing protein 1